MLNLYKDVIITLKIIENNIIKLIILYFFLSLMFKGFSFVSIGEKIRINIAETMLATSKNNRMKFIFSAKKLINPTKTILLVVASSHTVSDFAW